MMFELVTSDVDIITPIIFPHGFKLNTDLHEVPGGGSADIDRDGTIYQPLRSGRIWHKVNF